MPDESAKKCPRDPSRVDIHDHAEVEYWCKRISCTRAQLIIAVHTVGPILDGVIAFLREVAPRSYLQTISVKKLPAPVAPKPPTTFNV